MTENRSALSPQSEKEREKELARMDKPADSNGVATAGEASSDVRVSLLFPPVVGDGLKVILDGEPVWFGSLPANVRELKRGLENGMFGPPVPLGHRASQQWANAAMALGTVEDLIRVVDVLVRALVAGLPSAREAPSDASVSFSTEGKSQ